MKILDGKKENVNAKGFMGFTALIQAAENNHGPICNSLINAGANIEDTTNDGDTALIMAASHAAMSAVKVLVEKGAKLEARGFNGNTAIIAAAQNAHDEVVDYLIENGANEKATNNNGKTGLVLLIDDKNVKKQMQAKSGAAVKVWEDGKEYLDGVVEKIKAKISEIKEGDDDDSAKGSKKKSFFKKASKGEETEETKGDGEGDDPLAAIIAKLGDQKTLSAYEEMANAFTYDKELIDSYNEKGLPTLVAELHKEIREHKEEIEAKIIAVKAAEKQILNVKTSMSNADAVRERAADMRFHQAIKDEVAGMADRVDALEKEFSRIDANIKGGGASGRRCSIM
mmetsp:Transcript_30969/g.53237  ORF Transcript_30969/g.53237 Transcript_30969/m.53237 type:complete len:341 (-) Transcript_30969:486-1508(-)